MDKPVSYYAFEMLYCCGIREGELLALKPADFDFERQTVSITKSYQRIKGQEILSPNRKPSRATVLCRCQTFFLRRCMISSVSSTASASMTEYS